MTDRISVLIPAYNSAEYLSQAIESAIRQNVPIDTEIIVVDDGSTDDTREVCERYSQVKYIYQENRGPSAARNTLLHSMTGNYVAFLDADDIWTENKLSLQYEYLKAHPEVPFVGCLVHNFDAPEPVPPYTEDGNSIHYLIPCLIRKTVFDKTGFFCEDLRIGEDTDYRIRMRNCGITGEYIIPEVLLLRRKHTGSLTADRTDRREQLAAVLRKRVKEKYEKGSNSNIL